MVESDWINKLCKTANVDVEPIWPTLFAKCLTGQDIGALLACIGSAPATGAAAPPAGGAEAAAEEAKEESQEEESDDDMGFSLFD